MQAYLIANLQAMATLGRQLGHNDKAQGYEAAAQNLCAAMNSELWDEQAGFYRDRWGWPSTPLEVRTPASFIALYADNLVPHDRARRLLAHLTDPRQFWTRWPVPSVACDDPTFNPDEYWRGSTWLNVNWFIVRGLISAARRFADPAYLPPAKCIALRSLELVRQVGLREYYRSQPTDRDSAAAGFGPALSWSGLVLCLDELLMRDLAEVEALPCP